ncbi:zf-HC2 domain-containing protein [Isoptericola sp. NEAU-Y5]|uniref:Zf-HC2 domain-containing protein n=1 Tax=Isoptericola luteus TaxID=2879484 RepID=A0ABS7ZLE3_9MICO|nr:zf-HC2 domain-containing protein [Isoptericola sp. NEAU-Y5]MCA5894474.1 zf-HC2 domain-containing protein [Isoptericola sp. NEAU-Y5]
MTPTGPHGDPRRDPYREWDAAYVLGALGPAERRDFEEHLAGCDACRAAVAELAGMPGLLGSVPAEDVPAALGTAARAPDAADGRATVVPLSGLVHAARRTRRRRRTLTAVAASALLVGGVGAGLALGGSPDGGSAPGVAPSTTVPAAGAATLELEPVGTSGVRATLTATPRAWGTHLEWSCTYPETSSAGPSGRYDPAAPVGYELVLVDGAGERTVAATWTGTWPSSEELDAASAKLLSDLVSVEIAVEGSDEPLASAEL